MINYTTMAWSNGGPDQNGVYHLHSQNGRTQSLLIPVKHTKNPKNPQWFKKLLKNYWNPDNSADDYNTDDY